MRIMNLVLFNREMVGHQQNLTETTDARILSWFHYIPSSKVELLRQDGSVYEIMFQAVAIMKCASIPSHFSRSDLLLSPVAVSDIMCGDWRSARNSTFSRHTLTMKVLKAATELSSLAAITSPVENRTPFLVRMFSLSCVVQRAAFFEKGIMFDSTRDCIGLVRGIEIDGSDVGHFTIYVASNKSSFT